MKDIYFQAAGGGLQICIQIGYAQIGSYRLRLWESDSNTIILDKSGNNRNPEDDCYDLPLPNENNDGRYVQCEFSILSPDPKPGERYSAKLIFKQGDQDIGSIEDSGPISEKRECPELWAILRTP
jgi:hypothetical protein